MTFVGGKMHQVPMKSKSRDPVADFLFCLWCHLLNGASDCLEFLLDVSREVTYVFIDILIAFHATNYILSKLCGEAYA